MSPSPDTAPSPNSDDSSSSPPPPEKSSSSPPDNSSPPPPENSSPPPPENSSPPPPEKSSPPPPEKDSSPPSPPSGNKSPPSPPTQSNSSPPTPPSNSSPSPPSPPLARHENSTSPPAPPSKSNSSSGDDNSRAVVGGVLGVGSVLLIMIIVCVICSRKKKRKHMYYYGDRNSMPKGSGYYNSGQHHNWNTGPHGADHVVRVHHSNDQKGHGHGGGWGPPPPPPVLTSTDMSSNYSLGPPPLPPPSPSVALGLQGGTFSYEELASATEGFADKHLLGQGGFGYVHKGVLPNGKEVAVKSLKAGSGQGEREFQAEIDIISRVHHRHLVSLVGYCISGGQRMLVYEFVSNKTLEHHLHGKGLPTMDWSTRLRIAVGSAKGLAYLHEDCHPRIIHRDIKGANVLLDDSFEAKVADFGLAKLTTDNNTHVSTRVMGTFGYLAPEYASSGKLTEKSDVFSFGVMLLELITGKRPVDITNAMDDSLVDWARPLLTRGLEDGHFEELADAFLEGNYNNQEMARMAACASASIRHSGKKRPRMSQIVRALEGDVSLDDLNEGTKPGHGSVFTSSSGSSEYDATAYNADMKKFRQLALSSQEFGGSSEASSGEMGHHRENPRQHI